MVMACCDRCYEHYIEQNETVDPEFLKKNFGNKYTIVTEEIEEKMFVEIAKKRNQPIPMNTFIVAKGKKHKLCMCPCHVKGSHVFH